MWILFKADDTRRVKPKADGITTSTIHYKAGMVENVPREYGERLVAQGKAEATVSPAEKGKTDAETPTAKPGNGRTSKP